MPKKASDVKTNNRESRDVPVLPMSYDVRIQSLRMNGGMKATASVSLNGQFAVRGVSVIEGPNGLFVSMPDRKASTGEYYDICFPCTEEAHAEFSNAVMTAYKQAKSGVKQNAQTSEALPLRYDVRIHSLHPGDGSLRGTASVSLNGQFAIRRVSVMESSKGLFVSMPGFRGGNGMFKDYCFPCTKEARAEFDRAVLGAYEQALTQSQSAGQSMSGGQQMEAPDPFEDRARMGAPVLQM